MTRTNTVTNTGTATNSHTATGTSTYTQVQTGTGTTTATSTQTTTGTSIAVYQIDAGNNNAVSPFSGDQYGSGGTLRSVANTITTSGITNPAPMAVYQSERYGDSSYTFPNLTPGSQYTVRLHFAELYWSAAGQRTFNVVINGTTVLSNFDIFASAGGNYRAVLREFTTGADSSGQIVVAFNTVTNNATIGGIEIIRPIRPLDASPDPLVFPSTTIGSLAYAMATLSNNTTTSQTITAASTTGAFWVTWAGTCSGKVLAGNASCTLQLGFQPVAGGPAFGAATVSFASGATLTFGLQGSGM